MSKELHICLIGDESFPMNWENGDTIKSIKEKIAPLYQCHPNEINFFHLGRLLQNEIKIESIDLSERHHLVLSKSILNVPKFPPQSSNISSSKQTPSTKPAQKIISTDSSDGKSNALPFPQQVSHSDALLDEKVKQIIDLEFGFLEADIRKALIKTNCDAEEAINYLIESQSQTNSSSIDSFANQESLEIQQINDQLDSHDRKIIQDIVNKTHHSFQEVSNIYLAFGKDQKETIETLKQCN